MTSAEVRREVLANAIRACLTGDVGLCEQVFTADVVCSSPTMAASSRDELETLLSSRADALANIELTIDRLLDLEDAVAAEWHVAAAHARPFVIAEDTRLVADREMLVLTGATFADFSGVRISVIRHYFDRAALLEQLRAE